MNMRKKFEENEFLEKVEAFCRIVSNIAENMKLNAREFFFSLKALEKGVEISDKKVAKEYDEHAKSFVEECAKDTEKISKAWKTKPSHRTYLG